MIKNMNSFIVHILLKWKDLNDIMIPMFWVFFSALKYMNKSRNTAAFERIKTYESPEIVLFNEDERSKMKPCNDCIDYYTG